MRVLKVKIAQKKSIDTKTHKFCLPDGFCNIIRRPPPFPFWLFYNLPQRGSGNSGRRLPAKNKTRVIITNDEENHILSICQKRVNGNKKSNQHEHAAYIIDTL
jgi:hypothetical protein